MDVVGWKSSLSEAGPSLIVVPMETGRSDKRQTVGFRVIRSTFFVVSTASSLALLACSLDIHMAAALYADTAADVSSALGGSLLCFGTHTVLSRAFWG